MDTADCMFNYSVRKQTLITVIAHQVMEITPTIGKLGDF